MEKKDNSDDGDVLETAYTVHVAGPDSETASPSSPVAGMHDSNQLKRSLTSRHLSFIAFGSGIGVGEYKKGVGLSFRTLRGHWPSTRCRWSTGGTTLLCSDRRQCVVCRELSTVRANEDPIGWRACHTGMSYLATPSDNSIPLTRLGRGWLRDLSTQRWGLRSDGHVSEPLDAAEADWYNMALSVAVEVTAVAILVSYWTTEISAAVWIAISLAAIFAFNFLPVRFYGDAEVATASIKVVTLIGYAHRLV